MSTLPITAPEVSISIVSHLQAMMVGQLLQDLGHLCEACPLEVVLTVNVPETLPFSESDFPFPLLILRNSTPQGFGANHNQAFARARGRFFFVLNPDVRLTSDPFHALRGCLADSSVGVVAPLVQDSKGHTEDSARRFPTPLRILARLLGVHGGLDYPHMDRISFPDWVGGMALLFPREVFAKLGGFDTRYFLYYEDVDICARAWLAGYRVLQCPQARVIHDAQRHSHRSLRYLRWHLSSMMRFFLSSVYWRARWLRLTHSHAH